MQRIKEEAHGKHSEASSRTSTHSDQVSRQSPVLSPFLRRFILQHRVLPSSECNSLSSPWHSFAIPQNHPQDSSTAIRVGYFPYGICSSETQLGLIIANWC